MMHIVERIEEALRVGLEADVAAVQGFLEFLVLRVERILAVRTERVALQEEGMRSVAHDVVVRVLAALGDDGLRDEAAVVVPEVEIRRDVRGIADLLERQHIRPERIHIARVGLLEDLAQCEARVEQQVFLLLLRHVARLLRIVVVAENVVRHSLDIEPRALVRDGDPLGDLDEVVRVHVLLDELRALLRHSHREQRLVLIARENTVEVLHDHGKARVIVPLLLRQHELQRHRRLDGHLALDRTDSAHICLSLNGGTTCGLKSGCKEQSLRIGRRRP